MVYMFSKNIFQTMFQNKLIIFKRINKNPNKTIQLGLIIRLIRLVGCVYRDRNRAINRKFLIK